MLKFRNLNTLGLLLAALVLAGCSSTATDTEPAAEQAPPADTTDTAPITETVEEKSDFDSSGNPLDANGNPLSRTYYFDYDKSALRPGDLGSLEVHAQILRRNPDRSVVIEGHCDERGTREYNLALGEARADTIRSFLLSAGVSSRQIETVSYGEEQPADPGHDESAWSRNRRGVMSYR
ncbi:MAG: peptidoglycan-associated lipoprotein Pal [Pseudomonadota bacterium]